MMLMKKAVIPLLIAIIILIFAILIKTLNFNVLEIIEREKCPACFGISMCQNIYNNMITFVYTDFYSIFNNLLSVKNVYYAMYYNKKVILKKLAHKSELDNFDAMVCNNTELHELCFDKIQMNNTKTNFYEQILFELNNSDVLDPNNKIIVCPTITKINELLINIEKQIVTENEDYYKFLWTSIKINPEPIILQILSAENDWPTPKYFGACGRIIIEEYIGLTLSAFKEESWILRAKLASSLLDAAYKFTFKNSQFAFYLTDISMDNIAVNAQYRAIFIDLENIIIVDKYPSMDVLRNIDTWNEIYTNEVDTDCQDCLIFSPMDICSHKISDHNYYAICQLIFTQKLGTDMHNQGFLHDPPDDVLEKYPIFIYLLQQCSKPDEFISRIDVGIQLQKILDAIIADAK